MLRIIKILIGLNAGIFMTKYKHIIKYNIVIYFVIYLGITIWSFLDKQIHLDDLFTSLYSAVLLIIGVIPAGFALTLVLITLQKKLMLDWLYKKRSNGRYSITQGNLPAISPRKFTAIASTKKSLTSNQLDWLTNLSEGQSIYANLFLKIAGILKQNRNALTELNESGFLYTHSKRITDEIIKLQKMDEEDILKQFVQDDNFNKYKLELKDIISALRSPLIVIIGLCHDIGKLDSPIYSGQTSYLPDFGIRGRNLLAKFDETWLLDKNEYNDLFIVLANYTNYDNSPKLLVNGELIFKSINATCLTVILLYCHSIGSRNIEVDELESLEDNEHIDEIEQCAQLATEVLAIPVKVDEVVSKHIVQDDEPTEAIEQVVPVAQVFKIPNTPLDKTLLDEAPKELDVNNIFISNNNQPFTPKKYPERESNTEIKGLFTAVSSQKNQSKTPRKSLNSTYSADPRKIGQKLYSIHNKVNDKLPGEENG